MNIPVSIKGIVLQANKVILLKNEHDEWELPGGRLEPGETPEACVKREIEEELGLSIEVENILDAWVYPVLPEKSVFIVTYYCRIMVESALKLSHEHQAVGLFSYDEVERLSIPAGYKRSIQLVAASMKTLHS